MRRALFTPAQTGVLAACTIGNIVSMTPAVHSVFGLFLVPLSETFGWSRASISVALGIMSLTGAVVYPIAGRFADRHGARRMLLAANIAFAAGIAALALTNGSLPLFYLTFFLVSLAGSVASTPIYSKVIADWFAERRGIALGISAGAGSGLGSVAMPVLAALVVSAQGWRAGYVAIGIAVLAIGFPTLWLLLRDAPRTVVQATDAPGGGISLASAARQPRFWLILVSVALGAGCTTAIFSHVVPIVGDRGFSVGVGTAVVSLFALVGSTWQIVTGRLLDRVDSPRVVLPMYAMAIVGLLLLEFGGGAAALMLGGVLLGVGLGAQFGALPFYIGRYFGLEAFGLIIGVMYSAVIAGQGITPVLLDAAFDAQGSYRAAVVAASGLLAIGAGLLLFLPRYGVAAEEQALPLVPELG